MKKRNFYIELLFLVFILNIFLMIIFKNHFLSKILNQFTNILDGLSMFFCYGILIMFCLFLAIVPIIFTIFTIMDIKELDKKEK